MVIKGMVNLKIFVLKLSLKKFYMLVNHDRISEVATTNLI